MKFNRSAILLIGFFSTLSGCATVPNEVVQLSSRMGGDLQSIHASYKALVHERFESFRTERLTYFEKDWEPHFIQNWVHDGRLLDVAAGQVVWSKTDRAFVQPSNESKDEQMLASIDVWAKSAIKQLDIKKKSLLDPLDADEKQFMDGLDEIFDRLYRANTTITAHLNSIQKVHAVQKEMLEELHVGNLQEQLNSMLVKASDKAQGGLDEIKKADDAIEKVKANLPAKRSE